MVHSIFIYLIYIYSIYLISINYIFKYLEKKYLLSIITLKTIRFFKEVSSATAYFILKYMQFSHTHKEEVHVIIGLYIRLQMFQK